jgi:predicted RND superfamily exporter protein
MNSEAPGFWLRILRLGTVHPVASTLFLLLVSVTAGFGLPRLTLDTGFDMLMVRDASVRQAYLQVTREFGSDNRTFLYLRDEQLWSPAKLQALEQLHDELRQLPFIDRIDDLFSTPIIRGVDGRLNAQPILTHAPTDNLGVENARAIALEDPITVRNLVSVDGKSLAIGISIREAAQGNREQSIHDALEKVIARARTELPTLVQVGPQRIQAEIGQGVMHDLRLLGPLSALVLALVVFGLSRNIFRVAATLATLSISLLWTFGAMGLFGIPVTLLSTMLPPLVVAMSSLRIARLTPSRSTTVNGQGVIDHVAQRSGGSASIAALTLVLGFACQAFSGIAAIRDFGLAAVFAILANSLVTLLLVPVLDRLLGKRLAQQANERSSRVLAGLAAYAVGLVRNRLILSGLALAILAGSAALLMAPHLRIAHEPLTFFGEDSALVQVAERMHEELAGINVLYITLDANSEGAFRDPANLQRLADIQAFILKQEIFDYSLSLADFVSQANREAAGGRPEAYQVPPTRKLVSQYLLLHRPQDLEPYVSHDFRRANIVVRHNVRDSATLNRHIREMHSAIAHYAGPSMTTSVAGYDALIDAATDRLIKVGVITVSVLLAFVLVALSLMFTSAKGGGIAMLLSAIPVLMILGIMRVQEIPLSMATISLMVISIAMTVQGASRLFSRYSELCRNANVYDDAASEALKQELGPMLAISLGLVAGFGALLLSDFAPVRQFGILACTALLLSGLANIFIAPLVLSRIRLVGLYEILAMSMQREALENSPLFSGLSNYQIRKTILISELSEYRNGECLIEQGTVGRNMYIIVGGQVEIVRRGEGGEQRLAVLNPGEVFGEIGFVHEAYRTADVRALGAVSVLRFDHNRLKKDLLLFPHIMAKLNFNISGILGKRLAEFVEASQPPTPSSPSPLITNPDH